MYKYMKVGLIHFMAYPFHDEGGGPIVETVKKIVVDDYSMQSNFRGSRISRSGARSSRCLRRPIMTVAYGGQRGC